MSGLCPEPASLSSATTWSASTRTPTKIERLREGRDPDLRARASTGWWRTMCVRGSTDVRHPVSPTRSAMPTPYSSPSVRPRGAATAMPICPTFTQRRPRLRERSRSYTVIVTKSTVPVGTGREVARIIRGVAARRRVRRGLQSGVPARRRGDRGFHEAGSRRDRCREPARTRRDVRGLPAAQPDPDADGVHQHRDGRSHQVRGQRLSRDQDHLHQ